MSPRNILRRLMTRRAPSWPGMTEFAADTKATRDLMRSEGLTRPSHSPNLVLNVVIQLLGCGWAVAMLLLHWSGNLAGIGQSLAIHTGNGAFITFAQILGMALTIALWRRYQYLSWLPMLAIALDVVSQNPVVSGVALFAVATQGSNWRLVVTFAVAIASYLPNVLIYPNDLIANALAGLVYLCLAVGLGLYTGARRDLLLTLKDRADRAETTQFAQAAQARSTERARIAREMHDIVAHKISLISLHAGGLEVQQNPNPEKVRESAALIRETATQALHELRGVLGVLRASDGGERAPQATWDDVLGLIRSTQAAGIKVRFNNYIDPQFQTPDEIPDALSRTVHRLLQESLTNVHKHATHTLVVITLQGRPQGTMTVEVKNPLPVGQITALPGAGMGLTGLRERVELSQGTLQAGAHNGYFIVRAEIPWVSEK